MNIYKSIDEFTPVANAIVTIGTFDGVHVGHQKLIQRIIELAAEINGEVVLLTFFPHPRMVLYPDSHGLQLLNTMDEKIVLLRQFGVKHLIIHPFSKEFSRLNATEFVRDILVNKIGLKKLVIGYDHHFGRNREGSIEALKELSQLYDFDVEQIPEQDINDIAVSSTKIRNALQSGDMKIANQFLGYNYSLNGLVVEGKRIGRTIGFPTANISIGEDYKLIPALGVYAVKVMLNENGAEKIYKGALSIGTRPTFDDGAVSIEVFIMDFDKNIYGESISIQLIAKLRDEMKFDTVDELVIRMKSDVETAAQIVALV